MNIAGPRRYQIHQITDNVRHCCRKVLLALQAKVPDLVSAGVVGPDGFEVAAISERPADISKVAALTSTLVAVAEAFTLESGMESCRDIILNTNGSSILLLSIPVEEAIYALFVVAGKGATLGRVLTCARMSAVEVQAALSQPALS